MSALAVGGGIAVALLLGLAIGYLMGGAAKLGGEEDARPLPARESFFRFSRQVATLGEELKRRDAEEAWRDY